MANLHQLVDAFGNVGKLRELITTASEDDLNQALAAAAKNGELAAVKALIPASNPRRPGTMALILAAENRHFDVVCALIPVCDVKAQDSLALAAAAQNGDLRMVQVLKERSDVRADYSRALRIAAANGHDEVLDELVGSNIDDIFRQQVGLARNKTRAGTRELIDKLTPRVCRYSQRLAMRLFVRRSQLKKMPNLMHEHDELFKRLDFRSAKSQQRKLRDILTPAAARNRPRL